MPEYEFLCKTCGKQFTAFMHVEEHDRSVPECPKCHQKKQIEKLIPHVTVLTSRKSTASP